MFTRLSSKVLAGVLTSALLYAAPAAAQYSVTDLGDLGGGAALAVAVNNRAQVGGISFREDFTHKPDLSGRTAR